MSCKSFFSFFAKVGHFFFTIGKKYVKIYVNIKLNISVYQNRNKNMNFNFPKITVITGHYGCGKTNVAVNIALKLAESQKVTVVT